MRWPMLLDMTETECNHALRSMELTVYAGVMSVFRAHGQLSSDRRRILSELASMWSISIDRHRAEARRVANDEKLNTIAYRLFGGGGGDSFRDEWVMEGRLTVPPLQRATPLTAYSRVADAVCRRQSHLAAKLAPPSRSATYRPDLENRAPLPESPIVQWASMHTTQSSNTTRLPAHSSSFPSPPLSSSLSQSAEVSAAIPVVFASTTGASGKMKRDVSLSPSVGEIGGAHMSISSERSSPALQKCQLSTGGAVGSNRKRRRTSSSSECSLFESTTIAERSDSDTSSTCFIRYSSPTPPTVRSTPLPKRSASRGAPPSTHSSRPPQLQCSPPALLASPPSVSASASSLVVSSTVSSVARQSSVVPPGGISSNHSRRVVRPNQRSTVPTAAADRSNQQLPATATVDPNTESYRQLAGGSLSDLRVKSTVRPPTPAVSAGKRPLSVVSARNPAKPSQLVVSPASSVRIISHTSPSSQSPSSLSSSSSSATECPSIITISSTAVGTSTSTSGTISTNCSTGVNSISSSSGSHRVTSMVVMPPPSLSSQPTLHRPIKMVSVNQHSNKMAATSQHTNKVVAVGQHMNKMAVVCQQSNKVAIVSQRPNKMATVAVAGAPLVSTVPSAGRVISVGRSTLNTLVASSLPASLPSKLPQPPAAATTTTILTTNSHVIASGGANSGSVLTSRRTYSRRAANDTTSPATAPVTSTSLLPQLRRVSPGVVTSQHPSVIYLQRTPLLARAQTPRAQQLVRCVRPPMRAVATVRAVGRVAGPLVASTSSVISEATRDTLVITVSSRNDESSSSFASCLSLSDILQATGISPSTDWNVLSDSVEASSSVEVLNSAALGCVNSTVDNTAPDHVRVTSSQLDSATTDEVPSAISRTEVPVRSDSAPISFVSSPTESLLTDAGRTSHEDSHLSETTPPDTAISQ